MKIIIFVLLKIAEMAGGFGILYWFYWSGKQWNIYQGFKVEVEWWKLAGTGLAVNLAGIAILFIVGIVGYGLIKLGQENWKWANRILEKRQRN